ncbi:hypothetical protein [Streptomyces sp. NPDC048603]|uniref:hypothetical protein n=1 Tax=Streptomyces sp. NPDC048603 TaxID=3365577 RepID=UPI00371DE7DD
MAGERTDAGTRKGTGTGTGTDAGAARQANRPARVSAFLACGGSALLGNFFTGIAWINPAVFLGMAVLSGLLAIAAGHIGRLRRPQGEGDGRGLALLGIIGGWLVLLATALAVALAVLVLGGLGALASLFQ